MKKGKQKQKTKTKKQNKKHLGRESTKQPTAQLLQLYQFFDPHDPS